jgi:hypothetical protein
VLFYGSGRDEESGRNFFVGKTFDDEVKHIGLTCANAEPYPTLWSAG